VIRNAGEATSCKGVITKTGARFFLGGRVARAALTQLRMKVDGNEFDMRGQEGIVSAMAKLWTETIRGKREEAARQSEAPTSREGIDAFTALGAGAQSATSARPEDSSQVVLAADPPS
jgi:hypothetical protein